MNWSALFDDPMVQSGIAPFVVALAVAFVLAPARLGWLGIVAGIATVVALSTGISFSPLTAGRKVVLLVLLAPLLGWFVDHFASTRRGALLPALAVLAGLASAWVFLTVIAQRDGLEAWLLGGGVAAFVALLVGLTLRLADDGVAAGGAALGLGLAVGVSAVLSASIGNLMNGIALAAAGGAMLLLQLVRGQPMPAGFVGALTIGLAAALFAAATFVLAELRWYALVLLLAVPAVAALPLFRDRPQRVRTVLVPVVCVLVASATILAAWLATRSSAS